jgi:hypothetical protein
VVEQQVFYSNKYCGENPKLKVAILARCRCTSESSYLVEDVVMLPMLFEPNELVKYYPRGERIARTFPSIFFW